MYYLFVLDDNDFAIILINNTDIHNKNVMLKNIIDTVPDPIFVKNEQHVYQYVNQAFADALGCTPYELLGKSDSDFFSQKESDVFYKIDRKTFKSEVPTTNVEEFTGKADGVRIVSTKKSIFRTLNNKKILVGVIRDITEITAARKIVSKQAQELKRQVDSRTKQLKARTDELERAVETLKSLNSDLDCFAHMCCHELREPLRTISSFSRLAMDEDALLPNSNIHQYLEVIQEGTLKMDRLIKSILNYSTNGLCSNLMSVFYPHELIEEVMQMLDVPICDRKAVIHYDKMPAIYADRMQVLQLFQNLINNSIKFCDASHVPVIDIKARSVNDFIEFKLKDNGLGIAKRYHKELFLPFKKFHSRAAGSSAGIGLSLCKKIIDNHKGSIKFSSREGLGTTFTFLLPSNEGGI
jgi:PAS domain S-box-containing protein